MSTTVCTHTHSLTHSLTHSFTLTHSLLHTLSSQSNWEQARRLVASTSKMLTEDMGERFKVMVMCDPKHTRPPVLFGADTNR